MQLPVIYELATRFAICDHWYSSLPGPTWPNRFFLHGGLLLWLRRQSNERPDVRVGDPGKRFQVSEWVHLSEASSERYSVPHLQ